MSKITQIQLSPSYFESRAKGRWLAWLWLALALILCRSPAASETAAVFAANKNQVAQVQLLDIASGSKASIGSGFVVSKQGLVVTNFHVVAELIYNPDRYLAEYVFEDGRRGKLELNAIDVVHDLALLQAQDLTGDALQLADSEPSNGERLYAFGNPHDLGLTIVEGTYNGLLEKSIYDKIHFTASINPGMSGGPTVDRSGRVVGVNVSTAGNQLSFLVPVKYVAQLLTQPPLHSSAAFIEHARTQLLANQADYIGRLLTTPLVTTHMSDYEMVGRLAPFLSCWGDTQQKPEALYEWAYQSCSTSDDLFLSDNQTSGIVSFTHELFSTEHLGSTRFFGFLQQQFQRFRPSNGADEEMVTNFDCETRFVSHADVNTKVVFCLRAYKKFDGLFDAYMKAAVLSRPGEALHSTLDIAGVSFENAVQLSRLFLESIRWQH